MILPCVAIAVGWCGVNSEIYAPYLGQMLALSKFNFDRSPFSLCISCLDDCSCSPHMNAVLFSKKKTHHTTPDCCSFQKKKKEHLNGGETVMQDRYMMRGVVQRSPS